MDRPTKRHKDQQTDRRTDRQTGRQADGELGRPTDGQVGRWTITQADRPTYMQIERRPTERKADGPSADRQAAATQPKDKQTDRSAHRPLACGPIGPQTERQSGIRTMRHPDNQADRWTPRRGSCPTTRQTDRQTDRPADGPPESPKDRHVRRTGQQTNQLKDTEHQGIDRPADRQTERWLAERETYRPTYRQAARQGQPEKPRETPTDEQADRQTTIPPSHQPVERRTGRAATGRRTERHRVQFLPSGQAAETRQTDRQANRWADCETTGRPTDHSRTTGPGGRTERESDNLI